MRRGVAVGRIAPGEWLHGYRELRDEGLVELRRGRGAAVRRDTVPATAALWAAVAALVVEARRAGQGDDETASLVEEEMP